MFNGEPMFSRDYETNGFDQTIELVLSPLSVTIIKLGD